MDTGQYSNAIIESVCVKLFIVLQIHCFCGTLFGHFLNLAGVYYRNVVWSIWVLTENQSL